MNERGLYIVGDIHGKFLTFEKSMGDKKNSDFILAGDVGLGLHTNNVYVDWMSQWNDELKKDDNTIYLLRGNHDDPSFWNDNKISFSNIILIKDYDVLRLKNKNILCVGGAISVDRKYRKEGHTYWKEEEFVLNEDILNGLKDINIVVTHSAPEFAFPRGYDTPFLKSFYYGDPELRTDLMVERSEISRMYNVLITKSLFKQNNEIYAWYYGHFHQKKEEYHNDIMFRLCNIGEIVEVK